MATNMTTNGMTTHYGDALRVERRISHTAMHDADRLMKHVERAYEVAGKPLPKGAPDVSAFLRGLQGETVQDIAAEVTDRILSVPADEQAAYGREIRERLDIAMLADISPAREAVGRAVLHRVTTVWSDARKALNPAFERAVKTLADIGREVTQDGPLRTLDPATLGRERRVNVLTRLADIEGALSTIGAVAYLPRPHGRYDGTGAASLVVRYDGRVPTFDASALVGDRGWGDDLLLLNLAGGAFEGITNVEWSIDGHDD